MSERRYSGRTMTNPNHAAVDAVERVLTTHGIAIRTTWFDESTSTAAEAAAALGVDLGAIVKSLVFMLDDDIVLILVSGSHQVDTTWLGSQLGGTFKRASASDVKEVTGQVIGGVSPIGHPREIRTLVDEALGDYKEVWASAGHPRAVFPTSYAELLQLTRGEPIRVVSA
jgi:prolyl-tRNA editing enzyme YbaK/EbsC (Cys-tRNA(Pro) deacylase)